MRFPGRMVAGTTAVSASTFYQAGNVKKRAMAKKDAQVNENMDRGNGKEKVRNNDGPPEDHQATQPEEEGHTRVKNASASGMGSLGKSREADEGIKNEEY